MHILLFQVPGMLKREPVDLLATDALKRVRGNRSDLSVAMIVKEARMSAGRCKTCSTCASMPVKSSIFFSLFADNECVNVEEDMRWEAYLKCFVKQESLIHTSSLASLKMHMDSIPTTNQHL